MWLLEGSWLDAGSWPWCRRFLAATRTPCPGWVYLKGQSHEISTPFFVLSNTYTRSGPLITVMQRVFSILQMSNMNVSCHKEIFFVIKTFLCHQWIFFVIKEFSLSSKNFLCHQRIFFIIKNFHCTVNLLRNWKLKLIEVVTWYYFCSGFSEHIKLIKCLSFEHIFLLRNLLH